MRTIEELKAFCEGYVNGTAACNASLYDWDDWVVWGGYDINFVGSDYTSEELNASALLVVAYPAGWEVNLPDHLYSFTVTANNTTTTN